MTSLFASANCLLDPTSYLMNTHERRFHPLVQLALFSEKVRTINGNVLEIVREVDSLPCGSDDKSRDTKKKSLFRIGPGRYKVDRTNSQQCLC